MQKACVETLNYITVYYANRWLESVKLMVQEHYDTPEYKNTIIFLGCLPEDMPFYEVLKQKFNRRIYYFLEHRVPDEHYRNTQWDWYDNNFIEELKASSYFTEIWSIDYRPQFPVKCEQELGIPCIYRPVRYTSLIKPIENIYTTPKTVDTCMVGVLCYDALHRLEFIQNLEKTKQFSLKTIDPGPNIQQLVPELNMSRYIIDMPRNTNLFTQNQVRIFELLCMGYSVCVEKYSINLFPGLIYEFETIDDLANIIKKGEYLHPTEAYKEMTYTNEAYETYVNNLTKQWNTLG